MQATEPLLLLLLLMHKVIVVTEVASESLTDVLSVN